MAYLIRVQEGTFNRIFQKVEIREEYRLYHAGHQGTITNAQNMGVLEDDIDFFMFC